ncbi:class I SAM-dependent methyltransferase [Paraglaciecola sp.]|uniref:class I SAM-dependent methyltransferase n=1 Tax=Paraglaciecola sp. TaxID=1920173 RepID=UPI00326595B2
MLSAPSQLLMRNEEVFQTGKWLLVNPTDSHITTQLNNAELYSFHQYFDVYQQSFAQGQPNKHLFAASYPTKDKFDGAVIYMPKSKEQAKMLIANIAACLKTGADLLLVGENKGGVKSASKMLDTVSSQVNKIDSARHCALFAAKIDKEVKPFELAQWQKTFDIAIAGVEYKICSLPGVFNHGSIDNGTNVLLNSEIDIPNGRVLDFGCGAGVIGCFLGLKNPKSQIVMSDVSALAVHCSRESANLNGLKVEVVASNGLSEINGKFTSVFTNPPFHTGIQTDYSVTESFIVQVKQYLVANGSLTLVANKFLRYSELLEKRFKMVTLLKQTTQFSVYLCSRVK